MMTKPDLVRTPLGTMGAAIAVATPRAAVLVTFLLAIAFLCTRDVVIEVVRARSAADIARLGSRQRPVNAWHPTRLPWVTRARAYVQKLRHFEDRHRD